MTRGSRYILLTAIAAMTACTDELPMQNPAAPDEYIPGLEGYDFMIATEETYSRTVYTDHFHSEFADKDRLGAFSLQYPETEGQFDITAPATGWRDGEPNRNSVYTVHVLSNLNPDGNGTDIQRLQVLAGPTGGTALTIQKGGYLLYYPYDEAFNDASFDRTATTPTTTNFANLAYSVKIDQRKDEDFEKSDLLWDVVTTENSYTGDKIEETGSNPIKVYMDHVMATIVVKIHKDSLDTDYGVRLLNLFDTAWGADLTRNVHLADDVTKPEATSPTQLCANGHQLRCKYTASDASGNTDDANRTASFNMHLESYRDDADKDMLVFRAAVPAYQTIAKDQEILDVKLFNERDKINGDVTTVRTVYKSASDVILLPGHNYIFTLHSGQLPAIKDITDEDSWVLDVFDPETNDIVGMLCREYLRYQPDHTGEGNRQIEDEITGTSYTPDNGIPTKYISSQAWVFYPLSDDVTLRAQKIPHLKEGTVLRFLYDIRSAFNGSKEYNNETYSGWPYPHKYGMNGINVSQGIFLPEHGHRWVKGARNGESSKEWVEHYMHGGTIEWEKTQDYTGADYYRIGKFTLPERQTTNEQAKLYGHIAIDAEGNATVSYTPFSGVPEKGGTPVYDDDGKKVAYTIEHYLIDDKDSRGEAYPLVKIGYNNFWTSKALHRNMDGSNLVRFNDDSNPYRLKYTVDDITDENGNCQAGYLYPVANDADCKFSVYKDAFDVRYNFPLLYNLAAIKDPDFLPSFTGDIAPGDRFKCFLPKKYQFQRTLAYFGWKFGAKLMTSYSRLRDEDSGIDGFVQTPEEALHDNRIINTGYNSYAANVSGFNLRTNGVHWYSAGLGMSFGFSCGFWIDNNYGESDTNPIQLVTFDAYEVFTTTDFSKLFGEYYPSGDERNLQFVSVRFLMKMIGQDDMAEFTVPSVNADKSVLNTKRVNAQKINRNASRNVSVGLTRSN